MNLLITATYASCLALVFFALTIMVVKNRRKSAVSLGDGQIDDLQKVVRAHGNFTEYVPICLVLLATAEINAQAHTFLHIAGGLLLVGRVLHAYGLITTTGASVPRIIGMLCTFTVLISLAVWNLFVVFTL